MCLVPVFVCVLGYVRSRVLLDWRQHHAVSDGASYKTWRFLESPQRRGSLAENDLRTLLCCWRGSWGVSHLLEHTPYIQLFFLPLNLHNNNQRARNQWFVHPRLLYVTLFPVLICFFQLPMARSNPGQAVALLLSLGVATGCVSDVVRVAKILLGKDAPALPPSAGTHVERLRDYFMPHKVGLS